ncbi:MAG: ABC transporter substrate-binding protein, partial [Burkholderiales bacterium]|nr:ABC transporter substrate-binding protein [Anaerolineae bacterium]
PNPNRFLSILFVLLTLAMLTAPAAAQDTANVTDGCVTDYDPAVDYFPDKAEFEYATGVEVEYFNNYKVVTVLQPWPGADTSYQYVLVQCGTPAPAAADFPDAQVIDVPIDSIITMSTTFLPPLDSLGVADTLMGVDETDFVSTASVRERIDSGEVVEVGGGAEVNVELTLDLEPDVVMTDSFGSPEYDEHPKLLEAGLTVVMNADWVEIEPLGWAEWVKFMALFYNREAQATALFDEVETHYNELVALAADVAERPTVMTGIQYDGIWYTSGGDSYFAQILEDAGADYLWADDSTMGSLSLDLESVLDRAADADYWVNANQFWFSLDDIAAEDERYTEFAPFQNQTIYANNARLNEFGGNDYYESGAAHPDLILADLISIFHPDLLPDHELVFYQQLQPAE